MPDYKLIFEAACRVLPEIVVGITFVAMKRKIDTKQAYLFLEEMGFSKKDIQDNSALINDLSDFDRLKKSWDNIWLMCILSYTVLAFTAPIWLIAAGISVWVIAVVIARLLIDEEGPEGRYKSRHILNWIILVVLLLSATGKIATVFSRASQSIPAATQPPSV